MKEIIPPGTKQGEAVTYTLNEYQKLVRYMKYAFATADDNMAENTIRPFAIGRKNWLFCDSPSSTLSPRVHCCREKFAGRNRYLTDGVLICVR